MKENQLQAGTAVTDITPPLEVGLLTSSTKGTYAAFESVRLPLYARVLVLRSGNEVVAMVALDLLTMNDTAVNGWERFKKSIAGSISFNRIIITCTHTHNAPESCALSNLYLSADYQQWLEGIEQKISHAINEAMDALQACRVAVASDSLEDWSLQRRIATNKGIIMSDSVQPIAPELMVREPVDRRVRMITLQGLEGTVIATIVHAVCHPVHEMCMPHVSSDYPGELCKALELAGDHGMPLFLNGAAGDINPPTVSDGPEYARQHGQALATLVQNKTGGLSLNTSAFGYSHTTYRFVTRPEAKITNEEDALGRLYVLSIGSLAIVFLPGEPFVELALEIENNSPFEHTVVVGYAENYIGYILTARAFDEGGYEAGPGKWSYLEKGAGMQLCKEAVGLLEEVYGREVGRRRIYEGRLKD